MSSNLQLLNSIFPSWDDIALQAILDNNNDELEMTIDVICTMTSDITPPAPATSLLPDDFLKLPTTTNLSHETSAEMKLQEEQDAYLATILQDQLFCSGLDMEMFKNFSSARGNL